MKLNNHQLVVKYIADTLPPPQQYGAVSAYLINVYFTLFIFAHNDQKTVRMFAQIIY